MTDSTVAPSTDESQPVRPLFFTLVSAQVIFVANGEANMLTKQTFASAADQNYTARHILHLQNTVATQVKNEVEASGQTFDKLIDVVILALVPLGLMTGEEFWDGMNDLVDSSTAANDDAVIQIPPSQL